MTNLINIRYDQKPWTSNYDPHVPATLRYPNLTLMDLFQAAVNKFPKAVFIHYQSEILSFCETEEAVDQLAVLLVERGLRTGDRIALLLPNIPQFVIAYFATLRAGGIVVAMNPNYKIQEYEFLFKDSAPSQVICLDRHLTLLEDIGIPKKDILIARSVEGENPPNDSQKTKKFGFDEFFKKPHRSSHLEFPEINPDHAAIFQYSGGTTGIPKAAIGSHRNIIANIHQFRTWCNLTDGKEKILAVIPLYHVYGMVLTMSLAIATGSQLVLIDDPGNTEMILKEIEEKKISFYPGVPTMYYAITQNPKVLAGDFDIQSIKACISGSFPLHPKIKADFEKLTGGKLVEGYGLSEAPTATHCNPVFGKNKAGSIGLPLPDVECKVVDLVTGENEVEIGEAGELIIRGPQVMSGYHRKPIEESETLRDGWLYTGDVVRMDEEGYFFIVDRKKSLIKVGGLQVWPNEIESVILTHPGVAACAVGGVPEMTMGEKVVAWIIKKPGISLIEEDIRKFCQSRIAGYKVPSIILFRESLPKSGVGKTLRRELIREYIEKETS